MNLYLATFVVRGSDSDTEAINSAVSVLDFIPVIRAVNMHVFLIRSEKTHAQLESLLTECCDPDDFVHLAEHRTSPGGRRGSRECVTFRGPECHTLACCVSERGCAPVGGAASAWRVVAVGLVARHVVGAGPG